MENDAEMGVVQAVDAAKKPQDNLIRLSTGVVLRGKQSPPLILMAVMSNFPRPKAPVFKSEVMGREMENTSDPDYLDRVKSWQTEQSNAILNTLILTGTELVEKPTNIPGPDEKEWVDELQLTGVEIHPDSKGWRYLRWVQFKAATSADDLKAILEVVGRLSGVPEKAVKSAEAFPGSDKASGGGGQAGN